MASDELHTLKQAWLASGLFADEQAYLAARVRQGRARFVYLDPDETCGQWLMVVIRYPTDVIYGTQCAGVATEQRFVEGYLVPLSGLQFRPEHGSIQSAALRAVFHQGRSCMWGWTGLNLPADRLTQLGALVEAIPYWQHSGLDVESRSQLRLDQDHSSEIAEAWIPVRTPDGSGVLLYDNCD